MLEQRHVARVVGQKVFQFLPGRAEVAGALEGLSQTQGQLAPFLWLAHHYALLTRYDAVAHPSLPNYLALVSGSTQGVRYDCTRCVFSGRNLGETLTAHSLTWKMYVEHLPLYLRQGPGITGPEKARLPFLYFRNLLGPSGRLTVPLPAFYRDLGRRHLPSFSLVIPDLCHDMHSCSIAKGDRWMHGFLRRVLQPGLLAKTALFVVFDEGRWSDVRGGGGRVAAIVAGPLVRPQPAAYDRGRTRPACARPIGFRAADHGHLAAAVNSGS